MLKPIKTAPSLNRSVKANGKYVLHEICISYSQYTALYNFIKVLNSVSFDMHVGMSCQTATLTKGSHYSKCVILFFFKVSIQILIPNVLALPFLILTSEFIHPPFIFSQALGA